MAIITHYSVLITCFPPAPDDSTIYIFLYSSEIRNHNFLYVAMVTGLALSTSGEEFVFCSHRGLNSFWTQWPADMEQQLPSLRLRLLSHLFAAVCLCPSSPPTTLNVRFHPRTASTFVMLWKTSTNFLATGSFMQRAEGLNCAALKCDV